MTSPAEHFIDGVENAVNNFVPFDISKIPLSDKFITTMAVSCFFVIAIVLSFVIGIQNKRIITIIIEITEAIELSKTAYTEHETVNEIHRRIIAFLLKISVINNNGKNSTGNKRNI